MIAWSLCSRDESISEPITFVVTASSTHENAILLRYVYCTAQSLVNNAVSRTTQATETTEISLYKIEKV